MSTFIKDFITRAGVIVQGTSAVTSSSGQTGALQVNSGAAINKNLIVGTSAQVYGATNLYSTLNVTGNTTLSSLTVTNTATFSNININDSAVLNTLTVNLSTILNGSFISNAAVNTFSGHLFVTGTNTLNVGTGSSYFAGIVNITNETTATVNGNGALKVSGGVYIDDNLVIKSTEANTGTTSSNSLYVAGGAWIDKSLVVGGPTLFQDTVVFNGTATYVFSTNTYYTDNIVNLHVPPGGIDDFWDLDDGKDIGFKFHYFTQGTDTNAALVLANDTKWLEWYSAGAEGTSTFAGASYGTFKTGAIVLASNTATNSTQTGALQVAGGIGVGGGVYSGGTVSAGILAGRNLTQDRLVFVGTNNTLIDDSRLTFNTATGVLNTVVSTSTTALNLTGGAAGSLPYQLSSTQTAFLAIGTPGYVLTSQGGFPEWTPLSGTQAGSAITATNLLNGGPGQLPYQISSGVTGFVGTGTSGQLLQSNGSSGPSFVNTGNIFVGYSVYSKNLLNGGAGAIPIQSGSGATAFIAPGNTGTFLSHDGITATFVATSTMFVAAAVLATTVAGGTAGQLLYQSNTGTTSFAGPGNAGEVLVSKGSGSPVYQNTLTLAGTSTSISTTTGALVVNGGVGIGGNLNASGLIKFSNTEDSSLYNTGSVVVSGGVGIAKNLHVGQSITIGQASAGSVVNAIYSNNVLLSSYTSPVIQSTSTQTLDTLSTSSYRTARYTVQVVDINNNVHVSELVLFHDGANAYVNEYGIATNNGERGTFGAEINTGNMNLLFNAVSTVSTTIKIVRLALTQ